MQNHVILQATTHRPYPLARGPWLMRQSWHELLFIHWPLMPEQIRAKVPEPLEIDMYGTETWIGIVPFRMSHVRPHLLPSFPPLSNFPELNVRVYVTYQGRPGVYFFSLEAGNPIAVQIARTAFHLPYMNAQMECKQDQSEIHYYSRRTHKGEPPAEFAARYQPIAPIEYAETGSLASWFTERYCLYATAGTHLYRAEIHHVQWPLQKATLEITTNTMATAHGIQLPATQPQLHYSERQDVLVWPPHRLHQVS